MRRPGGLRSDAPPTVGAVLAAASAQLSAAGVPTPAVDAELLVRHALGWSRARLLTAAGQRLDPAAAEALERLLARRAGREPLQLLVGSVGFRRVELHTRAGVFIPRPETEVLAGEAIARTPRGGTVVEPCTGSGAVACAVADEVSGATVLATDRSPAAVALARHNAARLGLAVDVRLGDLLAPLEERWRGSVDVMVANPPYLALRELAGLEPEVVDWEPSDALVAGPTGLEVAERLVAAAPRWLAPGGWLVVEVDPSRAAAVAAVMAATGLRDAVVVPDLTGADRVVAGRWPAGGRPGPAR